MARAPVIYDGTMPGSHKLLTGLHLHEAFHYTQNADPGAVGASKYWLDTTSSPYVLYRRNAANAAWVNVGLAAASVAPSNAKYITQTADATLTAEQAIGALSSGLLVGTTTTGVILSRSLAAGTGITVTNATGIAGNPTAAVDTTVVPLKSDNLSVFASTTSLQLKTLLSDETGSGSAVFAGAPTLTGAIAIESGGPTIQSGSSTPEGVVTAPIGSLFMRNDLSTLGAQHYQKAAGTGSDGWVLSDGWHRRRTERQWAKDHGAATVSTYGMTAPTITGTATSGDTGNGNLLNLATTNVSGNVASIVTPNLVRSDQGYEWVARVVPIDVTSTRYWAGLFSGDPSGSATPAVSMAAFRGDTGAGDTNWKCVTSDGATRSIVDSGITFNTTLRDFRIVGDDTAIRFYIGDVFIVQTTTPIPAAGTSLSHRETLTTLAAAIKNFRVSYLRLLSR